MEILESNQEDQNLVTKSPTVEKTKITIKGILEDLANGLTRTNTHAGYYAEIGCIQDKYSLSDFDMTQLFKHKDLKGKKTHKKQVVSFVIVED